MKKCSKVLVKKVCTKRSKELRKCACMESCKKLGKNARKVGRN